jgi:hypothetical protein
VTAVEKIAALLLELGNLTQDYFDVLALLLQNAAAFLQNLLQALDLRVLVFGGIVHIDQLTDFGQRQSQPLSAQG